MKKLKEIEQLEYKYLEKFSDLLKFSREEILTGLSTREKIKNDWVGLYGTKISDFSTGAERVIYSILNGKGVGQVNSAPVGSDMFFEMPDAFIHIDLKTVGASLKKNSNIGDFKENIFVGTNQNSYSSDIIIYEGKKDEFKRLYKPALPPVYNKNKSNEKICLTFFVTMLYDKDTLDTLVINIMCMPNGQLNSVYKNLPLKAGKNKNKTRFNFSRTENFELLKEKKRVKIVYFDEQMNGEYQKKLKWQYDLFKKQNS